MGSSSLLSSLAPKLRPGESPPGERERERGRERERERERRERGEREEREHALLFSIFIKSSLMGVPKRA